MTEPNDTLQSDHPEYLSLAEALRQNSPAAVATAIEAKGSTLHAWDRFGRWLPVKQGSKELNEALDHCATVYEHTYDPQYEPEPVDDDTVDNPLYLFGWPNASVPMFVERASWRVPPASRTASAETKLRDSVLVIVAGMMRKSNLSPDHVNTVGKLMDCVTLAGLSISEDKVRQVLAELPGAMRRRKTKTQKPNSGISP